MKNTFVKLSYLFVILMTFMVAGCSIINPAPAASQEKPRVTGYTDTPLLPNSSWRVHDDNRPRPTVIDGGTASTNRKAGTPPSDAILLFDGTKASLDNWLGKDKKKKNGPEPKERAPLWKVKNGYFEVTNTGDIWTKQSFGSGQYHIEFATPADVVSNSQGRGNSGFFIMGTYELQILDSYNNKAYADGQAAAIYGQNPPLVNASRAPGKWQTYDIIFHAPKFEKNKLVKPATITVLHNGVLVQDHFMILGGATHRQVAKYKAHPKVLPLKLQDHGNPIRFRNIWVRPLED